MIDDPPLLTIRRHFERPDAALLARLAGTQTGYVTDALGGGGAMASGIKPVERRQAAFVGVALTCETGPSDNLAIMAALALAKPGDVIVAAAGGFAEAAVTGDNVAAMARNAGVVALVTDGGVRDAAGIVEVGLPVFAAAVTPNSGARNGPGRIGLPVVVGGVAVVSGDVVVGDADGVVVVPREALAGVISRIEQITGMERAMQGKIAEGLTSTDQIKALLASDRVRYLD